MLFYWHINLTSGDVIMKKKLQVFISSTYTDLIEERQAAVAAILKKGHIPAGMELFTAGDKTQMETIKRWIDESDVYMLILGGRYGSVEPSTGISYTELEYDYALEQSKPLFAVVIQEDYLEKKVKAYGSNFMEKANPKELNLFREKVLKKMSSFFSDIKDIKLTVHETLSDYESKNDLKGWVRADSIVDPQALYNEITELKNENKKLVSELETYKDRFLKDEQSNSLTSNEENISEVIEILKNIEIETSALSAKGNNAKYDLLTIFYIFSDCFVTGISNKYHANKTENYLYYNICPKLQIHGIVRNEKNSNVEWGRFFLTPFGEKILAYKVKSEISSKKKSVAKDKKSI